MRVLQIIPYRLQDVIDKGEVTDRYFNPGNVASHIDFLTYRRLPTDIAALQRMCGDATFTITKWNALPKRVPVTFDDLVDRCDLIRASTRSDGWFAVHAKKPSLISVHADRRRCLDEIPFWARPAFWVEARRQEKICRRATHTVITSEGYRHIAPHADWIPNVVAPPMERPIIGGDYVYCVSRNMIGKGFEPMREATESLNRVWLEDDGGRPNEKIMRMMAYARVIALRNHYPGLSKTIQEALLTGTPLVLNEQAFDHAPELRHASVFYAHDSPEGYAKAIEKAWEYGPRPQPWANRVLHPDVTEAKWAQAYEETASCT